MNVTFATVRRDYPPSPSLDLSSAIRAEFDAANLRRRLTPGMSVAIAVGSRGIDQLALIIRTLVALLADAGAKPFILPAMGSHGGATARGQRAILAHYGITESALGIPIRDSMEVERVATTPEGVPAYCSVEARRAHAVFLVNRIKPHTDFGGNLGSGLLKMLVVGLGKHEGAAAYHRATLHHGYAQTLRSLAHTLIPQVPLLGGLAILEGFQHQTAAVELVLADQLVSREAALVQKALEWMPRLPVRRIDLLIVDRIGKDISGTGMDPNIIGRGVHGYHSLADDPNPNIPWIGRIYIRALSPGSNGNAIGMGMADFCSTALVSQVDRAMTYTNALTALSVQAAKIPITFETDKEAIRNALSSLGLSDPALARMVRIRDTLSLQRMQLSPPCLETAALWDPVTVETEPAPAAFGADDNLLPMDTDG